MSKIVDELVVDAQIDELERLCLPLFDRWCERKSVLPLAYLMSAWPIISLSRLLHALRALLQYHPQTLTPDEYQVVAQILRMGVHSVEEDAEHLVA
jgi:hypothetical protein